MERIKEFITRAPESADAWICICKNTPTDDGFYPCDERGNKVEPTAEEWTTNLYMCDKCGRIIDHDSLEVVGRHAA